MAMYQRGDQRRASRTRRRHAVTPTGANEPPRSDLPSTAPVMTAPEGGTGVGVSVVSAPAGEAAAADPNAVVKPVGPVNTVLPAAEGSSRCARPGKRHQAGSGTAERRQPQAARRRRAQDRPERRILEQEEKEEGPGEAEPVLSCDRNACKMPRPSGAAFHLWGPKPTRCLPVEWRRRRVRRLC